VRIPPRTRLCAVGEATHRIDASKVAPQVTRMARLAVTVVAAERHTSSIVCGNGTAAEVVAVAALVGEVALSDVDTFGGKGG
jgi:aspartate 1-decarboxylase